MTDKYTLLMYAVHSTLEQNRNELEYTESTTVENFRESEKNNFKCLEIHKWVLEAYKYELSWNQMCNGINLFLESNKRSVD
jgi:hypothetical protein